MNKTHIGILFGGKSTEHKISIKSARNIFKKIDKKIFIVSMIRISTEGFWYLEKKSNCALVEKNNYTKNIISIVLNSKFPFLVNNVPLKIDVIFPILHGKYGEDGSIQGLLRVINLPFVGSDILSSAISMDKDITKKILQASNISIAPFFCLKKKLYNKKTFNKIKFPVFIKPANQGSSIGISKAFNDKELHEAIEIAFDLDIKVIIENEIIGKEIECGILGNDNPKSSLCGEITLSNNSFYNYQSKYINNKYAKITIPAMILPEISKKIRKTALKVFKILDCKGMARVDFFLTPKNRIIVNEVNTLPGFTNISMYPKLWMASNLSYSDLIKQLIQFAIEYHNQKKLLIFNNINNV